MLRRPGSNGAGPSDGRIGEGSHFTGGELRFEGMLRVEGVVENVKISGQALVVGEKGRVTGRVEVASLAVYGQLDGHVSVRESALIATGGKFTGELEMLRPSLSVQEGGIFQGNVKIVEGAVT
jgi:cytoskeletal protein CcmA (bactofilin family)